MSEFRYPDGSRQESRRAPGGAGSGAVVAKLFDKVCSLATFFFGQIARNGPEPTGRWL